MEKNKPCIILFGLAGSGKGTQADFIKKNFRAVSIAPGDLLREKMKSGELPQDVVERVQKGGLVDPMFATNLVIEQLNLLSKRNDIDIVVLDGFPRNLTQDEYFKGTIKNEQKIFAIYFKIDEKQLLERLSDRFYCVKCNTIYNKKSKPTKVDGVCDVCGGEEFISRVDDADLEAIKKRIEIFTSETFLVVEKYRKDNLLEIVDASMEPVKVSDVVKSAILKRLSSK